MFVQDTCPQLEKGSIQKAYLGLMEYMMGLRTHLKKKYPEHFVSGFYQGYMDMSYFSFTPKSLKSRDLKIAIVFVFDTFRFEVWLGAKNKEVQEKSDPIYYCEARGRENTHSIVHQNTRQCCREHPVNAN